MSATDELRKMLDERGVEWMPCAWEPQTETFYKNREGVAFIAMESTAQNGFLLRTDMPVTPAQAIAATLGAGTCRLVETEHEQEIDHEFGNGYFTYGSYDCDECGHENAKLRELCADMLWTIKHAHGWYKNDTHEMLMTDVRGRDGEPTNVSHSLTTDEEMYEKRMRELGIEVDE